MPGRDIGLLQLQFEATIIEEYSHQEFVAITGTLTVSSHSLIAPCGQSRLSPERTRHESATASSYFAVRKSR